MSRLNTSDRVFPPRRNPVVPRQPRQIIVSRDRYGNTKTAPYRFGTYPIMETGATVLNHISVENAAALYTFAQQMEKRAKRQTAKLRAPSKPVRQDSDAADWEGAQEL